MIEPNLEINTEMGKIMKKLGALALAAGLAMTLVSCMGGVDDSGHDNGALTVHLVHLPDDTTVDCVTNGPAVTCDWATRG